MSEAAGVSSALAVSLCSRLETVGLVERALPTVKIDSGREPEVDLPSSWLLTKRGQEVLRLGVLGLEGTAVRQRPRSNRIIFLR